MCVLNNSCWSQKSAPFLWPLVVPSLEQFLGVILRRLHFALVCLGVTSLGLSCSRTIHEYHLQSYLNIYKYAGMKLQNLKRSSALFNMFVCVCELVWFLINKYVRTVLYSILGKPTVTQTITEYLATHMYVWFIVLSLKFSYLSLKEQSRHE